MSCIKWMLLLMMLSVLAVLPVAAQNNKEPKRLLYVVEGDQSYMIPYIERKLKNLRLPESVDLLYDSVASLNTILQVTSLRARMVDILSEIYGNSRDTSHRLKSDSLNLFAGYIRQYQSVLAIKVTPFDDLIEFQFTLYDTLSVGKGIRYRNSSSVFIDPRSDHYQSDITRALNQAFDKANKQPRVTLRPAIVKLDSLYYLPRGDSLVLDPIVEDESTEGDRLYFWREDSADSVKALLVPTRRTQTLVNLAPGNYHFSFYLSNGVSYSPIQRILLKVYDRPSLKVIRNNDFALIRAPKNRLLIQDYLLSENQIVFFTHQHLIYKRTDFDAEAPTIKVRICDQKGVQYTTHDFDSTVTNGHYASLNENGNKIIDDINNLNVPFFSTGTRQYYISYLVKDTVMQSNEVKDDLSVMVRQPISFVYDVMMAPINKNQLYGSWCNFAAGIDIHMSHYVFATALFGTNLARASFQHFYSNFIASAGPYHNCEAGIGVLVNHDRGMVDLGGKAAYTIFVGNRTKIKIAVSYYNEGNHDYVAIHYTGNIFFNH